MKKRYSNSEHNKMAFTHDENDAVMHIESRIDEINERLLVLLRRVRVIQDLIEAATAIYGNRDFFWDDIEVECAEDDESLELPDDLADFDLYEYLDLD